MAQASGVLPFDGNSHRGEGTYMTLEAKHKIFLSHSGAQKLFVECLCKELERCLRYPFFDRRTHSLPIGENFPKHIFDAIQQCHVGVVVLSKEFLTSKWPMMELVAMMEEARNRENFRVIPVFLRTSPGELRDAENQKQWRDCWVGLAAENNGRVEVEKWEAALKYLCSWNGLVNGGLDDFEFINKIVDAICEIVPPQIKLDDSHMEGRSRLCKVIRDKIDLQVTSKRSGVCKMGLYGMGGMGKTTICKALCNELFTKFHGRVCHAELEIHGEEKLLRDVLKRLSNKRQEQLNGFNLSELHNGLRNGEFIEAPMFLALDNMSDSNSSIMEAKRYLSAKLPNGSIIMVTSRSKESLTLLRPLIDENECMKMPELEGEEARALFVKSCEGRNEDDEQLIQQCIGRCRFENDGRETSYHYHPLALNVLGRELARLDDPRDWKVELDMINKDIFNQSNERDHHPIFSILRKSFDTLSADDQLLFMDVVLFLPGSKLIQNWKWLGMASKIGKLEDVKKGLERLKRKSLLESIGDERSGTSIRMHDLWHEFCITETNRGDSKQRLWVYERNTCSESSPCESVPEANNWGNVKRMALLDLELNSLGSVNFAHFPNVTVLKIKVPQINSKEKQVINLSGLLHLRSLEMWGNSSVTVQGLPRTLVFLSLQTYRKDSISKKPIVKQMEHLKELQSLNLSCYKGDKLPDMKNMVSLRTAVFFQCKNVVTVTAFSSNLRVLSFALCQNLQSCPGVGDLIALEELMCTGCEKLESLPNLGRLGKLRILNISDCDLISELLGVGDLVPLEELHARRCKKLSKLPDLGKLINLRVLDLEDCSSLAESPGFDSMISLQEVVAEFRAVVDKPNFQQLSKLQKVWINGWSPAGIQGVKNLTNLQDLEIGYCYGVDVLPGYETLTQLRSLTISSSAFKDVSGLSNLTALESLKIVGCENLEWLNSSGPLMALKQLDVLSCTTLTEVQDLAMFPALEWLDLSGCTQLNVLRCSGPLMALKRLDVLSCTTLTEVPDLAMFPALEWLDLRGCTQLNALRCSGPLMGLKRLEVKSFTTLTEVPDLAMFPALEWLDLRGYTQLNALRCSGPLIALKGLDVKSFTTLTEVPDLAMFPALEWLDLSGCTQLNALRCSGPLMALTSLDVDSCTTLIEVPDLAMFPALEWFDLRGCTQLNALRCNGPLMALKRLDVKSFTTLIEVPDLAMFPALEWLDLYGCTQLNVLRCSGPLMALKGLDVRSCTTLTEVPDLAMFPALELLDLRGCTQLNVLRCSGPLMALKGLDVKSFTTLTEVPDLAMFPALEWLDLSGYTQLSALRCSGPLMALKGLDVKSCTTLIEVSDLAMFPALEWLDLRGCTQLNALRCIGPLMALTSLDVESCTTLIEVPDLAMFSALELLDLSGCTQLNALRCSGHLMALKRLDVKSCTTLTEVPDLAMFPALEWLDLYGCTQLNVLRCSGPLMALISLDVESCTTLIEVPDLAMFPAIEWLDLRGCIQLNALSCSGPLMALTSLDVDSCTTLIEVPDLAMFRALEWLDLRGCTQLNALRCSGPLLALKRLNVRSCTTLIEVPDLAMFRALEWFDLSGCSQLNALRCSGLLMALTSLDVESCTTLIEVPDLAMFMQSNGLISEDAPN